MVLTGGRFQLLKTIQLQSLYESDACLKTKVAEILFFFNVVGDLEQKFELEISPLCNQQKDTIPSIQIGKY